MEQSSQVLQEPSRLREPLTIMLIGDGAVGKTSMITGYIFNSYSKEYTQTTFDVFSGLVHVNGVQTRIRLMDTAGQEEFDCFRALCYAHVDVVILCFSVVNPVSFDNISSKWIPQIRAHSPTAPIVLVGTQSDLHRDVDTLISLDRRGLRAVHYSQAHKMAKTIKACYYVECSSLTQTNLKEVFDFAIVAAIRDKTSKSSEGQKLLDRLKALSKGGWKKFLCFS